MSGDKVELRYVNYPIEAKQQFLFCPCGTDRPLRATGYVRNTQPPMFGHVCDGVGADGLTCGKDYYLPELYPKIVYVEPTAPKPAEEPKAEPEKEKKWNKR